MRNINHKNKIRMACVKDKKEITPSLIFGNTSINFMRITNKIIKCGGSGPIEVKEYEDLSVISLLLFQNQI
jgi:hypothetical protein